MKNCRDLPRIIYKHYLYMKILTLFIHKKMQGRCPTISFCHDYFATTKRAITVQVNVPYRPTRFLPL